MTWAFRLPQPSGEPVTVRLPSLPWKDLQALATKHTVGTFDPSWLTFAEWPQTVALNSIAAFQDLRDLAANHAGIEVDPIGDTAEEVRAVMLSELVQVDDDLPENWADGNPQTGSPETT